MDTGRRHVVVGYDGSDPAVAALDWAARRAADRGLRLEVVHGVRTRRRAPAAPPGTDPLLEAAAGQVRERHPLLPVDLCSEQATATTALLQRAAHAECLVLGAAAHGHPLGSVVDHVAGHAACPVAVVREGPGVGVVVGVDGSPLSDLAVGFAFAEADRLQQPLTAVHAWLPWHADEPEPFRADPPEAAREAAVLSERLAGHRELHPDVQVSRVVRGRHPLAALLEAAAGAGLVVVGSHGRGGLRSALLGSVSRALLHSAPCTTVVVRAPSRGR